MNKSVFDIHNGSLKLVKKYIYKYIIQLCKHFKNAHLIHILSVHFLENNTKRI